MPVLSMLTPTKSCFDAPKTHFAKLNERSADINSSRLSTFNVDVRYSSQVTLVIRISYS